MIVEFTKMEASGNDFIIIDERGKAPENKISDLNSFAKFASRRRFSVGADGVLVLCDSDKADFRMRIFNPDGSEAAMCGNGIRSTAFFAYAKGWRGTLLKIETGAGVLQAEVKVDSVMVKMTPPKDIKLDQYIGIGKTILNIHTANTGVPHAVHFVDKLGDYPVKEIGAKIRHHKRFEPEGTNADFVEVADRKTIFVRTYERGVEDETMACGTGVVASAVISHLVKAVENPVNAVTRGGDTLRIHFKKELNAFRDVYLEGKANIVFEGRLNYV